MRNERAATHVWFTLVTALCAVAASIGFILMGSTVARLTFTPHHATHETGAKHS